MYVAQPEVEILGGLAHIAPGGQWNDALEEVATVVVVVVVVAAGLEVVVAFEADS